MEYRNMTAFPGIVLSNFSGDIHLAVFYSRHIAGNIIGSLVTFLIAFVSIIGNLAVVIVSFTNENLRVQTGNLLVVYLSSVDILTATFVMLPSAISVASDYWPLGSKLCKVHALFNYMFTCSSSLDLTVISIDRAIAVVYPFKYRVMMTTRVMIALCFVCFILSLCVGIACGVPDWTSYDYTEALCAMQYTKEGSGVYYAFTGSCFCCYYIPIVILSVCNTTIILAARKSGKNVQTLFVRRDNANNMNNSLKEAAQSESQMKKTIKSMIVVVVAYYICFTPYALGKQVKVKMGIDMPPWFNYLSTIFIFVSSAVNPFIYAILRKDYRDAFKKLLKQMVRKFA